MAGGGLAVTVALAASAALGGALRAQPGSPMPVTPFGASVPVHIAHVGHIDVDLVSAGTGSLSRVQCGRSAAGTACFVGSR
jgi:hypothetical protein